MAQPDQTLVVTVSGPPDQLSAFAQLCLTIENLCAIGASRTVELDVDGDGSGALSFDFGDTDVSDVDPVETDDGSTVRVAGIGE